MPSTTRNSSVFEDLSPILSGTHLKETENQGGFENNSSFEGLLRKKSGSEKIVYEKEGEDAKPSERNSIPTGTHLKESQNVSGFSRNLVFERLHSISNESAKVLDTNESSNLFEKNEILNIESGSENCDFTKGKWVYDDSLPLYTNDSCPFTDEGFDCWGNGRSDKNYMKWRWQLQDCEIPRFNATKMLEMIRGKRLVFVGDSINRNQWESMLCLLMGAIKDPKRVYETHGRRITKEKGDYNFKFVDYKCTIEYYVTHFLVHEGKARVGKKRVQTLRIDTMDRGSSRWKGADILVFNTAHWWTHSKTKSGINYYQEGGVVHSHLEASLAFRRALKTWATWVDRYINPHKTHVFFRSSSPSHFSGGQWNSGGHCKEATQPLSSDWVSNYCEKNVIVEEVIREMKTNVTVLNITGLSEYRIDAHPSVYGRKQIFKRPSNTIQDCSHWCLPGVPDTWNEMLYYNLYLKGR